MEQRWGQMRQRRRRWEEAAAARERQQEKENVDSAQQQKKKKTAAAKSAGKQRKLKRELALAAAAPVLLPLPTGPPKVGDTVSVEPCSVPGVNRVGGVGRPPHPELHALPAGHGCARAGAAAPVAVIAAFEPQRRRPRACTCMAAITEFRKMCDP